MIVYFVSAAFKLLEGNMTCYMTCSKCTFCGIHRLVFPWFSGNEVIPKVNNLVLNEVIYQVAFRKNR